MEEDNAWYHLYDELCSEIKIILKEDVPYVTTCEADLPVNQFGGYIYHIASRFIGECRRNMEAQNQVPASFIDLLYKLDSLFLQQFNINFPDGDIPYPLHYDGHIIPAVNTSRDPYISVVFSKIRCISMVIRFLRNQLSSQAQVQTKHRIRMKADIRDFRTTQLNGKQLSEILKIGKKLRLFSSDTNQKDFIDIFSGRTVANPINWIGTIYSLNRFITRINGKAINKLTDGKWHVITQLFVVNGELILEESLLHPGKGKNDKLEQVDRLIDSFNHLEEFED